jgi:hypothetical protein
MLVALDFRLSKPQQIIIAGKPGLPDTEAMLREVGGRYLPNLVVLLADGGEAQAFLSQHVALLKEVKPLDGKATAYVCENFACQLPTNEVGKVREMLNGNAEKSGAK